MHQVLNRHVAPNSTISPHKQYVAVLADCIHRLASRPQIARKLVCNVDRYPRISCLISRPKCIAAELVAVMCEVAVFWGIRMFTSCSVIPVSPFQSEAIRDLLAGKFSPHHGLMCSGHAIAITRVWVSANCERRYTVLDPELEVFCLRSPSGGHAISNR